MKMIGHLLLLLMLALGGGAPAAAQGRGHMQVTLVPETRMVAPGQEVTLALVMKPEAGWHGYWRNPGDAGAEPRIAWSLPPGWQAGRLAYPVPDRLILLGLMNYVYERDHALLVTLRAPAGAAPGTAIPVDARLDYLVCTDELCVPETTRITAQLEVGPPRERNPIFDQYRRFMPRPLVQPGTFERSGGRFRLALPIPAGVAVTDPYFYPVSPDLVSHAAAQRFSRSGDRLILETEAGRGPAQDVEGVLEIGDGIGLAITAVPGQVPAAGTPIPSGDDAPVAGDGRAILLALVGALAGGLLLNLMPCVFPILSLKALSLARAGETEAVARREAVAYAAGVILTCLALGGLLLALRTGGATIGWAFQLQDPRVILLLLLLVTAVALNLAGLFRLPAMAGGDSLARSGGGRGAFFTGALAAFIATPCTGPFLGFALGAALVLPAWAALAVFAGLGLGLASPFLLLGFVPALRRALPKPGAWMDRLQRALSIPMFVTAIGLAWILGRQSGVDGMTIGIGAALTMGLGLWWLGRGQMRGRTWLPLIVVAVAALAPLPFVRTIVAEPSPRAGALSAVPFGETELARLRSEGVPVFLYFTADWCLTCKVNERAALEQSEVASAFRDRGIRVMVGDWTRGDAEIGRFLERHGRSGVPFYLYYHPGREAEILPQILTVGRLQRLGS